MTATNIVRLPQHRCLLAVTDGAHYDRDNVVRGIGTKVQTVPHWPGLITFRGSLIPAAIIAAELRVRFATFDAMVDGAVAALEEIAARHGYDRLGASPEMLVAGWSARHDRPESFVLYLNDELPPAADMAAAGAVQPQAFALVELPACTAGPMLSADARRAANWPGVKTDGSVAECIDDLLKLIRLQRAASFEGVDGSVVGGFAELTMIGPEAVSQSILERWPDKIGERIKPDAASVACSAVKTPT